jgi:hypothetical protein
VEQPPRGHYLARLNNDATRRCTRFLVRAFRRQRQEPACPPARPRREARRTLAAAAVGAATLAVALSACGPSVGGEGNGSPPPSPGGCKAPGSAPRFIAILIQGVGSKVDSNGPFNPAAQDLSYCASLDGRMPPDNGYLTIQSMAKGWLNYYPNKDSATVSSGDNCGAQAAGEEKTGQHCNLIDALAMAGGYVLPFSYSSTSTDPKHPTGAEMTGTQAKPLFKFPPYDGTTVATSNPTMLQDVPFDPGTPGYGIFEPNLLQEEIASIHNVFRQTPIIVIGHSNGGLIAEQWWLQFGSNNPMGVIHVFSLDSPLNGVAEGTFAPIVPNQWLQAANLAHTTLAAYDELWHQKDTLDAKAITLDRKQSLFTPIGSYGDPLYDMSDYGSDADGHYITGNPGDPGAGIMSQLFFGQQCLSNKGIFGKGLNERFDVTQQNCLPVTPDFTSSCADSWYHGEDYDTDPGYFADEHYTGETYNFVAHFHNTKFMHSLVKNCPGVVRKILSSITPASPKPGPSTAAQATAVKTFEPWVAAGRNGGSAPAPGLVVTNGGTSTCDSGSADDPGSAVAVRCSPPGNGTPCYINDIGGGDPGSPLLCSSDPTSGQVIEVTPTDPNGIPPGMLNPGDPSQPPWFLILADGRKCHLLGYGTNTNVLSYDCGNDIGATIPDRSTPTWTVQEGQLQVDPAPFPARVAVVTAYRGKTSFAAPAASPTPTPATPSSASVVVQDYYAAINAHDYQSAWSIGGKNLAGSYDSFVNGFANTASDSVTVTSVSGDTVMIQLDSTQTDGTHGYFTGTYTVQNDEIVSADVHAR